MSGPTPFEKPTDELRQVKRHILACHRPGAFAGFPPAITQVERVEVVLSVQRKWLVQVGELYDAAHPRTPSDIIVRRSESFHKDGLRAGNIGHWYCATREEWRDLPIA